MKKDVDIIRYNPTPDNGLSSTQVEERKEHKLVNKTKIVVGKSLAEILFSNVFSFFNIAYYIIAIFLIYSRQYRYLMFLIVITPNILIGLYEDLHARRLMKKMRIMTAPRAFVIRDGKEIEIPANEVVLDDVVVLKNSSQISADGVVLEGHISVNESLLTGESDNIHKGVGDKVLSGSFVTSGRAKVLMTAVGTDTYVEGIQGKANKFRRPESQILKSLKLMFKVIMVIVLVLGIASIVTNIYQGKLNINSADFKATIGAMAGAFVSMIPAGLFLLTSVALSSGVIKLSKKKTSVQEIYSIEMLARVDVLCVDKTGTITDATMKVKNIVPLNAYTVDQVSQLLANIVDATSDINPTAEAIKKYVSFKPTLSATGSLPFNSDNKYSGASFGTRGTYLMGAIEFLNIRNKNGLLYRAEEFTSKGYRVLCIGHSPLPIKGLKFDGELEPIALVVLEDNIRPEAISTFKWFKDNGVEIKVISGDNAQTVSEVAKSAGVQNADKFISLAGLSDDEVRESVAKYIVFGRVTPEQKEIIIEELKHQGKTVAMTGDGVNDILALKRADCSIAMANGSEAARNVAHIVLMDSNFSNLPSVVHEGRRVINNLQRTASLFLVKTFFAVVLTFAFMVASWFDRKITYPYLVTHMYIWESICVGLPAFFLALQSNQEKVNGKKFLTNVFSKAIPAGIIQVLIVGFYFILLALRKNGFLYLDLSLVEYTGSLKVPAGTTIGDLQIVAMSMMTFTIFALAVLYNICHPFDKYRRLIFGGSAALMAIAFAIEITSSYLWKGEDIFINTAFNYLTRYQWAIIGATTIIVSAVYIYFIYVIDYIKLAKQKRLEREELEHEIEN